MKRPGALIAEFVGTAVLVLAITGYVSASSKALEIFPLAIVHGLALMGIVYTIGSISGAHVNPAVTLAMVAIRKIEAREAGFYIIAQVLGAVLGALLAKLFFDVRGAFVNYGTPGLSPLYLNEGSVALGFLAEAVGTFILVWAIMGTAVNPDAPKGVAGAAIGGSLALGVLLFGPATGASFNPARWFGPALIAGEWSNAWMYILAPIVGGAAAALSYLAVMRLNEPQLPTQSARRGESAEPPVAV